MSEKDVIEKRNYPRCPIQLPLYYQKLDMTDANEKKSAQYWTKNVSLGGMCFETKELLQHEITLDIELHLPKETFSDYVSQDPMRLEGKVVWSGQKRTQSNLFEIGVEFVSIKEYDQKRIEECLQFFLQKQAWEDKAQSDVVCDLASQECVPCKGGVDPLKGPALAKLLELLGNSWQLIDGHHLEKEYTFKNFREALAFTNSVGELAEEQGHHPDIFLAWGKVKLTVWTHKIGGLTESDFIFAAKADQVL